MTDSNQRGKAHRHGRIMPVDRMLPRRSSRRRFNETIVESQVGVSAPEFILPDNNVFGHLDLRSLVDDFED